MPNIFWKKSKKSVKNLIEQKFNSEEQFESYVYNTKELLSNIFILKRQVRASGGRDIPDILGVDDDGNITIIEMKNTTVDENILPQILRYAIKWSYSSKQSLWISQIESAARFF